MMKACIPLFVLLALFSYTNANGNAPGNCETNGTIILPPPGINARPDAGYASYCKAGYGRPTGTCNCVYALNSCLQLLAGCTGAFGIEVGSFVPAIPSVLYYGQFYNFTINIDTVQNISFLCFLRPLPAGLSWVQTAAAPNSSFSIVGTPTETMPKADYGVAANRGNARGGFQSFFSFEIQSCSEADAVYPTFPPTNPPTNPPATPTPACTVGIRRCSSNSSVLPGSYQICDAGRGWEAQTCAPGERCCQTLGDAYCTRPTDTQLTCYN